MKNQKPENPFQLCKWCNFLAIIKQGRIWLCEKHYRFQQMRINAKRHNKCVPGYGELEAMHSILGMVCPACKRELNWLGCNGLSTVITLQHDRSGALNFLCRACNTRHAGFEGDSFYIIDHNKEKKCFKCKKILPLSSFYKDNSGRWKNKKSSCKECSNKTYNNWRIKNREYYNAKQRENRRKRNLANA